MISEKRKKIILTFGILIYVILTAYILQIHTIPLISPNKAESDVEEEFKFTQMGIDPPFPLEIEDFFSDNLDDLNFQSSSITSFIDEKIEAYLKNRR